jgi:iron complex outermembrane receptor protein
MQYVHGKKLIAIAVTMACSPSLFAEEFNEDKVMEEVSVVAKKTTYANNVIDQSMIKQQSSMTSVLSVMDNLPGISINEGDAFGGDDWSTSITMRGFSIDGNQQQLGMTIDGIPNGGSNYGGGAKANRYLDGENMSTVQVSQGTSDIASASLEALGGTFNFISLDPTQEQETTFAYTQGDHDSSRYFFRHNTGEIFGNTLAYFSYSQTSTNRWIGEGSNGGSDRQHAALKFISDFGDLTLTGRLSYDDVAEDNYNSVSIEQFEQTPDWDQLTWNWTGIPHFDQMFAEGWSTLRENTLGYLTFDYQISANSSLTVTPYFHKNSGRGDWIPPYLVNAIDKDGNSTDKGGTIEQKYGFTDQEGNPLAPAAGCTASYDWPWTSGPALHPACYDKTAVPVMSFRHTHYKKDRIGLTANYQLSLGINDFQTGIWLEQNNRDESRDWHKVVDARVYHNFDNKAYYTQYSNEFTTDTLKWYLQDTITLADFTFNLGAQQYLVDVEKHDKFANTTTKVNSDSDLLFSLGGMYQLNDSIELFAGYSENFSAIKDGVLERDSSTLSDIEPETAQNLDLGIRYANNNLSFTATAYSINFDNRITFIAPGSDSSGIDYTVGTNGTYINAGGIESQGFELSASYQANQYWSFYSSYTNNDSTYVGNVSGFEAGDKVIDSVDDMFVLSTEYFVGALTLGASGKYTGNRGVAPSYTVFDVNANYYKDLNGELFNSIEIAFVINNILDERYLATGTGNGKTFFIGGPRTASVTFSANF